jgi:hypothetical protein
MILELRLLSFSTGQPHPLAEQPVIFIDEKILPLDRQSAEIEVVGDFLILLITYFERSRNEDTFFFVRWKTGLTHCVSTTVVFRTFRGHCKFVRHRWSDTLILYV